MEYIHYGHDKFDFNKFVDIKNKELFNKPVGGLWASPVDAKYGWKEWCEAEDFANCDDINSFRFTLEESANTYQINSVSDILRMPLIQNEFNGVMKCPDFELMNKNGIDAIQFNLSNDQTDIGVYGKDMYFMLYGWDCDSLLVLNKDVVVPIER